MTQGLLNLYGTRETSRISNKERKAKGYDISERNLVFGVLKYYCTLNPIDGFTASEITNGILVNHGIDYCRNNVAKALTILRRRGLVEEKGTKICPITQRRVIAWRIS